LDELEQRSPVGRIRQLRDPLNMSNIFRWAQGVSWESPEGIDKVAGGNAPGNGPAHQARP
jgi:hypothetical protein